MCKLPPNRSRIRKDVESLAKPGGKWTVSDGPRTSVTKQDARLQEHLRIQSRSAAASMCFHCPCSWRVLLFRRHRGDLNLFVNRVVELSHKRFWIRADPAL